jgi:Undecaprenyl-phosphate glucose phosphotransferase
MIRRLAVTNFLLTIVVLLLPSLAFTLAFYIRFYSPFFQTLTKIFDIGQYLILLLLTTLVWTIASFHYGLAHIERLNALNRPNSELRACFVTYLVILCATFFYRSASYSRIFTLLSAVALYLLVVFARVMLRSVWEHHKSRQAIRILMVGTDDFAKRAADSLSRESLIPCSIVGFIRLPNQEIAVDGPVSELANVGALVTNHGLDDVVIAVPPARLAEIPSLLGRLEGLCAPIRAILDLGEDVIPEQKLFSFGKLQMLDLRSTPAESLMYLVCKRAFDLCFATVALTLAAPLMLLIAVAIKLSSRGPVLFGQERVGLNGKTFRMYKFRTMQMGHTHESDRRWTEQDDPRRTPVGALLRATSLDELPQFLNVLKGEMSVVGPRPERPFFVEQFLKDVASYNVRHYLKVGMTGWAQVNGWRGDTSITKRVEHDLYYLRNWSFGFDLRIVLLTVVHIFSPKNAY